MGAGNGIRADLDVGARERGRHKPPRGQNDRPAAVQEYGAPDQALTAARCGSSVISASRSSSSSSA